jgi:GMP synthase (glutamine-hydrolysing)
MMKPLLIVKAGNTYAEMAARFGDFEDWISTGLDRSTETIATVRPFCGEALPDPLSLGGIIITGSHDMVTDRHPWSEMTAAWIKCAVESDVPLLGICYGHQLLAHAMGGVVADNPEGREVGTVAVTLTEQGRHDRLLGEMPARFAAQACHSQSVLKLPAGATLLASSALDAHHAFAIGRRAWGVQFHPEFNSEVMRHYIQHLGADLVAQGADARACLAGVRETPQSREVLRRFGRYCLSTDSR